MLNPDFKRRNYKPQLTTQNVNTKDEFSFRKNAIRFAPEKHS